MSALHNAAPLFATAHYFTTQTTTQEHAQIMLVIWAARTFILYAKQLLTFRYYSILWAT